MITVPTRAEDLDSVASSHPAICLKLQRHLADVAVALMRKLPPAAENIQDLLRLGASCIQISGEQAFAARNERDAINRWAEVELGEKQIRSATFQALRAGYIHNRQYDDLFRVAAVATRARRDETLRLRRRLRQLAVI